MIFRTQSRRTLVLRPPAHCEDATRATERWLLSLWQSEPKRSWRLWREAAAISLEYVGNGEGVSLQTSLRDPVAADLSRHLLANLIPGVDLADEEAFHGGNDPHMHIVSTTCSLRSPGWLDIPKDNDPEGVLGVLAALEGLEGSDSGLLQLLLEPAWMRTEDGRQPAFWLAGRIVTTSSSRQRALQRARLVVGALGQFGGFNGLRVGPIRFHGFDQIRAAQTRRWPRRWLPPGHVATAAQVATLFHPPANAARAGRLIIAGARKTPAQSSTSGIALGEGRDYLGQTRPIRVDPKALLQHAFVLGPSGAGKSTLIAGLARELTAVGYGVTVFDPHGSLAADIARMLPTTRLAESALLRFGDATFPIALNPLLPPRGQESLAADGLVEVLQRVQSRAAWGPLLDLVLRHAALASIAVGGTIADTLRLLEDPWYRESVLDAVHDERTATFLRQLGDADAFDRRLLPAVHRLERLLATPTLRNILTQPRAGLDFAEAFERHRILLLDLSGIGATNTRLLGSLLLLLVRQAVFGGSVPTGEPRHFVLIDEASWFLSRTVSELFDQARKYGVGFVVVAQRLGQLQPEDVREAVLANAATFATFRVNERDEAATVAKHLGGELIGTSDLQRLPDYEAYVRFSRASAIHEPSWLRTLTPPPMPADAAARVVRLVANGRRWYARPVHEVEAELRAATATLADDEPEIAALAPPGAALPAHAA